MKASQVLREYQAGKRNFKGVNLRGQSFKEQDLSGADFSAADIRGADFTEAILRGSIFSKAKAGLQKRYAIGLVIVSLLMVALSGLCLGWSGAFVGLISDPEWEAKSVGLVSLIILIVLSGTTFFQGIVTGFRVLAGAVVIGVIVAGIIGRTGVVTGAVAVAVTVAFAGIIVGAIAVAVFLAITRAGAMTMSVAIVMEVILAYAGAGVFTVPGTATVAVIIPLACLSAYLGRRALKRDPIDVWIHRLAVFLAATFGTSFRQADLTDADFIEATLKSTDFRQATLTRTRWRNTKQLDLTRSGSTYLSNPKIRELVRTGQIKKKEKNFDRLNLRGVNLQGANLPEISFIGADLSEACLQDADLSRAKLVQTQLDATDFTGATLTGAIIEDWGITNKTKFNGVRCKYVYMQLPTHKNLAPLRKPDNNEEVFADGEFGDFIKPIVDTLDLYHAKGVAPRAIATAFKELAEKNPKAELEIVAIERRGEDKILLRAKTAKAANKSKLNKEYFIKYNEIKNLAEKDFKALIEEKEYRIRRLEDMIRTTLESPRFYVEKFQNNGEIMSDKRSEMSINQSGNFGVGVNQGQGEIKAGKLAGEIKEAQSLSLVKAATEIQQLLKQLEPSDPTNTTSEQMVVAAKAIEQIENNPTLKQRAIAALKAGGLKAFEEAIDHPAAKVVVAGIEGWQKAG